MNRSILTLSISVPDKAEKTTAEISVSAAIVVT